jgi:hypothetical protein
MFPLARWPGSNGTMVKALLKASADPDAIRVIQEVVLARDIVLHINAETIKLSALTITELCGISDIAIPVFLRSRVERQQARTVVGCLSMSMDASSSDPRDKVFGLFSLLPPRYQTFLPIDYSMSYNQVLSLAVMLTIAESGTLDVLRHAGLPDTLDCIDTCTFGLEEFSEYLRTFFEPKNPSSGFSITFTERRNVWSLRGDKTYQRSWKSHVLVQMVSTSQGLQHVPSDVSGSSSSIEQTSMIFPHQQILPRLKVRAHLVDISCGRFGDVYTSLYRTIWGLDNTRAEQTWLRRIFQHPKPQRGEPHGQDSGLRREHDDYINFNYEDFTDMCTPLRVDPNKYEHFPSPSQERPEPSLYTVFRTHYSIGCSERHHMPGDHVFAIDSVSELLLLRPIGNEVYRIVGPCYVWAALNLNYWNTGTCKGLLLDKPFDLGEGTRTIEIY